MPPLLTTNAIIMCDHGGRVELIPHQTTVAIEGGFVICEPDLIGAPIVGCALPTTAATSPCTNVVSVLPGSSAPAILVAGRPPYIGVLAGVTNSRPPAQIAVVFPGQVIAQAP